MPDLQLKGITEHGGPPGFVVEYYLGLSSSWPGLEVVVVQTQYQFSKEIVFYTFPTNQAPEVGNGVALWRRKKLNPSETAQ